MISQHLLRIKHSRLTMDFREIDSYLISNEDEDERPQISQTESDNSALRLGRVVWLSTRT